jgi:hypothetical protein
VGALALMNSGPFGATAWNVVSPEGIDTGNLIAGGDMGNTLWPQPNGFHNLRAPPSGTSLTAYASDGTFLRRLQLGGGLDAGGRYVPLAAAADPQGGSLFAKWAPGEGGTEVLTFQFLDATGLPRTAPGELLSLPQSDKRFIIAGVDTLGRALLLWGEYGETPWVGQWLNRSGEPLTKPFTFPAPTSAFEGSLHPLAGGGLALRSERQWLSHFPSGEAVAQPAPKWLVSHPGSELFLIRGQQANVLVTVPRLVEGSGCQESLLFFASDGTACGELLLPVSEGTCSGRQLGVGRDGTVIQQLASSDKQCSWRWWPALLK